MKKYRIPFLEIIVIALSLFVLVRGIGFSLWQKDASQNVRGEITFSLSAGGPQHILRVPAGDTLYEDLLAEKEKGGIFFTGKEYTGLGFFITEIGELKEGDGTHLFYYINGEEATVGVSTYTPKDGDHIDWKLK